MRRLLLAVTMAIVMAATVALSTGYAFAQAQGEGSLNNPNYLTTPAAALVGGPGGGCVDTYNAPTAEGAPAPGSDAAGGDPGYTFTESHPNNC